MSVITKNPFVRVYSNGYYIAIAALTAIAFWILLNVLDQLLFFWPAVVFYLPDEKVVSFSITTISSAILGLVVSLSVFSLKRSRDVKRLSSTLLPGSSLAVASCACAGCSTVGLSVLPTFLGGVGAVGIAYFAAYQDWIRVISLGILFLCLFYVHRKTKLVIASE